ncbi:MAG: hypothetical protein EOP11_05315 [Proteobacteria bacterium]|nr:MAG: hypothetical protein EOP11_05315 [Pseudomonadota bacterium]
MKKILVLALALLSTACATMPYQPYAREVKKKPGQGGLIALKTEHRPEDRARAESLMASNCGSDAIVKVTEEGEAVVGEKTNLSQNRYHDQKEATGFRLGGINFSNGSSRPEENTNSVTETIQLKEWQINYECAAIAAPVKKSKKGNGHK